MGAENPIEEMAGSKAWAKEVSKATNKAGKLSDTMSPESLEKAREACKNPEVAMDEAGFLFIQAEDIDLVAGFAPSQGVVWARELGISDDVIRVVWARRLENALKGAKQEGARDPG